MAKSNEERLRRELEILKAQIRSSSTLNQKPQDKRVELPKTGELLPESAKTVKTSYALNYDEIKSELKKTVSFSLLIGSIIVLLYLTEDKWLSLIKF